MPKVVLHVDDMYRHDPEDFPTLRNFLLGKGFLFHCVSEYNSAARKYKEKNYPEVLIMDILDETIDGRKDPIGVPTAEIIEDGNHSSSQAPCIIYYTGVSEGDPSIQRIKDRDPSTPVVFKSENPLRDAEEIYSHFPESLKK
jgi:hypothetical protein